MTFQLSTRSTDRLTGVHPKLVSVVRAAIAISKADFLVVEGMRTVEKQREYFNAGKSRTMNSKHLTGHAVDLCPLIDTDGDGKKEAVWTEQAFLPIADAMFQSSRALGIQISWGGNWQSFKDLPHWEIDPRMYPQ